MNYCKSILLIASFCFLSFQNGFGQSNGDLEVFTVVENMPIFNYDVCIKKIDKKAIYECSEQSFEEYTESISYPEEAFLEGMSGKVFVNFAVKEDSTTVVLDVIKSSGYEILDSAVIIHLQNMPQWIPGNQRAIKVPVIQTAKFDFYND